MSEEYHEIPAEPIPELTPSKKSITQLIKEKIKQKLDDGFEIEDKNSIDELRKTVIDELQIKKNWRSDVKKHIGAELKTRDISLADKGFKVDDVEGITINVDKPASPITETKTSEETLPSGQEATNYQSPGGALPESQEPQQLTKVQLESQERFFKKCGNIVTDIYIGLGMVETDDEEELKQLEKPKPIKQFRKEVDELAVELNQLMINYGMRMPKYLDIGMFALGVIVTFGVPVIKKVMNKNSESEPEYDEKLSEVEVVV